MEVRSKKQGGKRLNAGRKSKAEEMGLAGLLNECWTIASRKACLKKLATKARAGDIKAIKLLMEYTFGKPIQPISGDETKPLTVIVKHVKANGSSGQTD